MNLKGFITIPQLIARARAAGFDFGLGNPVNLVHHYGRLGFLPKATRVKPDGVVGHTVGCYPEFVVDRLLEIQTFRRQGLTITQIKANFSDKRITATSNLASKLWAEKMAQVLLKVVTLPGAVFPVALNSPALRGAFLVLGALVIVLSSAAATVFVAGNPNSYESSVLAVQTASISGDLDISVDETFPVGRNVALEVLVVEGITLKDTVTEEYYCIQIKNGEITKTIGLCD